MLRVELTSLGISHFVHFIHRLSTLLLVDDKIDEVIKWFLFLKWLNEY